MKKEKWNEKHISELLPSKFALAEYLRFFSKSRTIKIRISQGLGVHSR